MWLKVETVEVKTLQNQKGKDYDACIVRGTRLRGEQFGGNEDYERTFSIYHLGEMYETICQANPGGVIDLKFEKRGKYQVPVSCTIVKEAPGKPQTKTAPPEGTGNAPLSAAIQSTSASPELAAGIAAALLTQGMLVAGTFFKKTSTTDIIEEYYKNLTSKLAITMGGKGITPSDDPDDSQLPETPPPVDDEDIPF